MNFDFDLKYSYQVNPPSITFEKGEEKQTYSLKN